MIKVVYIAGPITKGNQFVNCADAIRLGEQVRKLGFCPIVPHLSSMWEMIAPGATYEDWLEYDFELINRSDALLRMPGESPGSDREVAKALELGIPVFYSVGEMLAARRGEEAPKVKRDRPNPQSIIRIAAKVGQFYGVSAEDLLGPWRTSKIANARLVAMYMARALTRESYPVLGAAFNRHHTTILSAVQKVEREMPEYQQDIAALYEHLAG